VCKPIGPSLAAPRDQAGLSFQRTRSWKASPDPDYKTRAARELKLYETTLSTGR